MVVVDEDFCTTVTMLTPGISSETLVGASVTMGDANGAAMIDGTYDMRFYLLLVRLAVICSGWPVCGI